MKTIKQFFTKKLCKSSKLLNNKGFSLIELLVSLSILGIISAIAIPQFQDYRESAGLTAANTSSANAVQAFNTCIALNNVGSCKDSSDLKLGHCSNCTVGSASNTFPICIEVETEVSGKTFRVCNEWTDGDNVSKVYGGDFKICQSQVSSCTAGAIFTANGNGNKYAVSDKQYNQVKKCSTSTDCTSSQPDPATGGTGCTWSPPTCENKTSAGECNTGTGKCSL